MNELEAYFQTYTQKLNALEKVSAGIDDAEKKVRSLMLDAIIKNGPTF
jgi:hypothetical protein